MALDELMGIRNAYPSLGETLLSEVVDGMVCMRGYLLGPLRVGPVVDGVSVFVDVEEAVEEMVGLAIY
jgi:Na+-translocating ferredoxin:NAD+ oxidoreductase RnfC subunit